MGVYLGKWALKFGLVHCFLSVCCRLLLDRGYWDRRTFDLYVKSLVLLCFNLTNLQCLNSAFWVFHDGQHTHKIWKVQIFSIHMGNITIMLIWNYEFTVRHILHSICKLNNGDLKWICLQSIPCTVCGKLRKIIISSNNSWKDGERNTIWGWNPLPSFHTLRNENIPSCSNNTWTILFDLFVTKFSRRTCNKSLRRILIAT